MSSRQQESQEMKIKRLKETVIAEIDLRREELIKMSLQIHSNPELGFKEFKASKLLADYLRNNDFKVEYPTCGLETAFRAVIGNSGPKIAILAEYDATPDVGDGVVGHGCGHNIIGTAAVGAGVALKSVIKEIEGEVVVFGTPAEEGGNGKDLMAKQGAFSDINAAMMIHPWNGDFLYHNTLACHLINIEFIGKGAHVATPERGINALDAMIIGFHAFKVMQPFLPFRVNPGIITKGGTWLGTVPSLTMAQFVIAARNDDELKDALIKMENCFKAGAIATGARLEFRHDWEKRYRTTYVNKIIADCFDANIRQIRPNWNPPVPFPGSEAISTDMGSVSQIIPSIHVWVEVAPPDVAWHSDESTAACSSGEGHKGMLDGAKAMAMTTIDLITQPSILKKAHEEFQNLWK